MSVNDKPLFQENSIMFSSGAEANVVFRSSFEKHLVRQNKYLYSIVYTTHTI